MPTGKYIASLLPKSEGRDLAGLPDGYREVRCPRLRGDVIAAERCMARQEQGCVCAAAFDACRGVLLATRPDLGNFPDVEIEKASRWKRARADRQIRHLRLLGAPA